MDYGEARLSSRFAKSCTTAAFGYARATSAAYAAMADQALEFWARSARSFAGGAASDESRDLELSTGPQPYRSAVSAAHVVPSSPTEFARLSNAWLDQAMVPVHAWWSLFSFESHPASWPMAYAMMTAGVPRAVALPAAEANLAAMDAAQLATREIDRMFAPYRSSGGHAVTPDVTQQWLGSLFQPSTFYQGQASLLQGHWPMAPKYPWAA